MTFEHSLRHKKGHRRHKMHKKHIKAPSSLCLMCFLFLFVANDLLRGGLYSFRLFANGKTELDLHISLNLSQSFRILTQRDFGIFAALTKSFALVREPGATFFHCPLSNGEIEQIT